MTSQQDVFFKTYINTPSPAGHEAAAQKIWTDYVSAYMDPRKDGFVHDPSYGSVAAVIVGNKSPDYRVVLDAHVDQIHWMVQRITENGHIGISAQGGMDIMTAPARDVYVYGKNGAVRGTIDMTAIHVRDADAKPTEADITVNIGAKTAEDATDMGISIGQPIVYAEKMRFAGPNDELVVAPGLDDKACGFVTAEIIRRLKEQNITLPYTLYVVNSAQEETGLRGAAVMAQKIKPHAAIALDVTFDTTGAGYNANEIGDIRVGNGPAMLHGAMQSKKLCDFIQQAVALEKLPPLQHETLHKGCDSGTNADSYAYHGAATALLSLPIYNMHTPAETASRSDIESMQETLLAVLCHITGKHNQFDAVGHVMPTLYKKFPNGPKF